MQYYCAPLEGLTGALFRSVHHRFFPGVDKYFTPFISVTQNHIFTPRERRELLPDIHHGIPTVPQLMTKQAEDFLWAARELESMGYREVNLNLGCPSATVTAKGKGSGFLAHLDLLELFLDEIFSSPSSLRISIKTRLGMRNSDAFPQLLALYNRYPLSELIIHPRIREDFYRGTVRMEEFDLAMAAYRCPICYNGDLVCLSDMEHLSARFPDLGAVMIGRGLIGNPGLVTYLTGGPALEKETLRAFLDTLEGEYRRAFASDRNAMFRMKEFWSYLIRLFDNSAVYGTKLRKAKDYREYATLVDEIFRHLPLLTALPGPFSA